MLLSRHECVKILENLTNGKSKLLAYQVVRDDTAIGYLGDYYALTISCCNAEREDIIHKKQLFIKTLPQQSAEVAKEAIFRKEAWFYETMLPKMQNYTKVKWSPFCYYTRPDLLVLEDIKLKGYRAVDASQLNENHLQQLMRSVAAFHAASLIYEHQTEVNIGVAYGDQLLEVTVASEIAWFTTGLSAVLAAVRSLPQYQGAKELHFIDNQLLAIMEGIYEQAEPSIKYRNVLCHRDLWIGNTFYPSEEDSGAALLVDFQTCRYTPPAQDLSYCLYMNLTSAYRREMEKSCIDVYYNYLVENLTEFGLKAEQLLTKAELLESFEEFRLFGIVYRAVAATIVKVPAAFVTNEFKYVDRSGVILDYMKTNQGFRTYMEECCVDVMNMAIDRAIM
ncbi:uncharacterized protein LOC117583870 [Drosophila guanche]|uniref:CHK kinase-like domain-containing protein n=1 Tax=Drosophila guanche TaxID=7266 RepID=A0A3B0JP53_DROGU|nr:uncharacterized protein LOC117583870 [Drosophila guanche]SPP82132.1 Hypothetical predicted protein [Drosophila guanche]